MREEFFPYRSLTHEVFEMIKIPLVMLIFRVLMA
jgi:hypothetical protein